MTLVEFVRARIAEDETVARAAADAPCRFGDGQGSLYGDGTTYDELVELGLGEGASAECGAHARRHTPARVLAECEARRHIVRRFARLEGRLAKFPNMVNGGEVAVMRQSVMDLAAVYSDHPDYREEWQR